MIKPKIPEDERRRLQALRDLKILDTPPEERFDRITRLAARIFDVPVALISLVDKDRQWFKSRQGMPVTETPRDVSFCGHAILNERAFVVPDALQDVRFQDNPLVTGDTNVRFYAGIPLTTVDGSCVGTLCVIDHRPRRFDSTQEQTLQDLAELVQEELGLSRIREAAVLLVEREEQLNDLFENASDLIQSMGPDGCFLFVNRAWRETLGYSHEEVATLHFLNVVHPNCKKACAEAFEKSLRGESVTDLEIVLQAKSGDPVYVSGSINCRFQNGKPVATRSIFRNITARRKADEALRESEEKMQAVLDNTSAVIFIKDLEGRYIQVNHQFETLFHVSRPDVIGRTDFDLFSHEYAQIFRRNDLEAIRTGMQVRIEEKVPQDDGVHTYLSTKFLLKTPAGAPYAVCGLAYDITDRKQMEEELRQKAALQRAILDSANVTIISCSPEGMIRTFNHAAEVKLGYRREEVVGKTTPMLIHDRSEIAARAQELSLELGTDIPAGFEAFVAKARLGPADEQEWTYIRKDGSRFPVLLSVTALRDPKGELTGFMGVGIDITERKEIERMKNEFISLVSHELRTPLTSIRGALGLVSGGVLGDIPREAHTMIDIATEDTERLVRLINGILDVEKIEAGKMDFHTETLDLVALVQLSIDTNRPFAMQSPVSLRFETDVPEAKVKVDGDRIIQVLTNLISNAIKFSPKNDTILLRLARCDKGYRVSVTDHGPGIPDSFRSRVFQKFAQADASASRPGGSGLGLSISRAIVEKHGGHIGFESEEGAGSTFYFDLPEAS